MAAIDFPNSPTVGEEFTSGDRTWVWDGSVWNAKETFAPANLNDLVDVNAPSPSIEDLLTWDGTDWVNVSIAGAGIAVSGHGHAQSDVTGLVDDLAAKVTNPMTTAGDLIIGGSSGTPARLAVGTSGQVLSSNGTTTTWTTPTPGVTTGKAIAMAIVFG